VPLETKAYELLALLLSRRPNALSKAQIRAVLWPGTFVSESALTSRVKAARRAVRDREGGGPGSETGARARTGAAQGAGTAGMVGGGARE